MTNKAEKGYLEGAEISTSTNVLVVGSGPAAGFAVRELIRMGHEVVLCSPEGPLTGNPRPWDRPTGIPVNLVSMPGDLEGNAGAEILATAEILEFQGSLGNFQVSLNTNDPVGQTRQVGAVMLANEPFLETTFEAWGMSESENVRDLSWVESRLSSSPHDLFFGGDVARKVVFICGFTHQSNPFSQKRAMKAAISLASGGINGVILFVEHLKVADYGLERLTHEAREAGVLLVRLSDSRPEIKGYAPNISVSYYDQELEETVKISPDLLVMDEAYKAWPGLALWADRLGIDRARSGFFQGDNIHNQPIYSNRNGIWVVGSAKGPTSPKEGLVEAKAAALEIHQALGGSGQVVGEKRLLFDEARCGKCLTCYRSCPHLAISYPEVKPRFHPLACRACGICAAACPMDAIQIAHFTDDEIERQIQEVLSGGPEQKEGNPARIVAFCCENSAFASARLASLMGLALPEGLGFVKVPCAGRVDVEYLLKALEYGSDGVMIVGCHHESCKSVRGDGLAKKRVEIIRKALEELGLEKDRLLFETCAPAMGWEFAKIAKKAEHVIRGLGKFH